MAHGARDDEVSSPDRARAGLAGVLGLLHRLSDAIQLSAYEIELAHGITAPQATCLRAIVLSGPLTQVELGRQVQLSTSSLTTILNRLERKGLITRIRSFQHVRRVTIVATTAGSNWDRASDHGIRAAQEREFQSLPQGEQQGIAAALELLARILGVKA
jgi:DNA-binding MarR family transcriptional regulator